MPKTKKTPVKYIPSPQQISGHEDTLENLNYAIDNSLPVLMIGETGTGKTALIRHLAHKQGKSFRRINLNGQTTVDEFVGKTLLNKEGTYWQDGVLTEALREGHWLLLDEINAALPEILFVLHSLLDDDRYIVLSEGNGEIVRPHPDFRLFATMNPSKYGGTKELNKAFLSRFPMILQLDFPTVSQEQKIVKLYSKLEATKIKALCQMAADLREAYNKEDIELVVSTRDLISTAKLAEGLNIKKALQLAILNRCNDADKKAVNTIIGLYFGKLNANYTEKRGDRVVIKTDIKKLLEGVKETHKYIANMMVQHASPYIPLKSELAPIKGSTSALEAYRAITTEEDRANFERTQLKAIIGSYGDMVKKLEIDHHNVTLLEKALLNDEV